MYPYLLPLFPILFYYSENADRMTPGEMISPAILVLLFTAVLHGICFLVTRNGKKASLLCFLILSVFGAFRLFALAFAPLDLERGSRDLAIFASMLLILTVSTYLVRRIQRGLAPLSKFLNIAVICLVAVQGIIAFQSTPATPPIKVAASPLPETSHSGPRPNIYYIILDAFGRADLLAELYQHDSSPFLGEMEKLGYVVASRSHSNYPATVFSLSSALNTMYLDEVAKEAGAKPKDRAPVKNLIRENSVVAELKNLGYEIYFLPSGYSGVDIAENDHQLTSPFLLSEFQNLLLNVSAIPALLRQLPWEGAKNWQFGAHRARVKFIFDTLPTISSRSSRPKFIFAHILTPHPPFIFNADGSTHNPTTQFSFNDGSHFTRGTKRRREYIEGYAQQVQFAETQLIEMSRKITSKDPEAIIVVQGDHGPGGHLDWKSLERTHLRERFSILNAYRVPAALREKIYPEITPVNSFRLIFGYLKGTEPELLPDRSFFFVWSRPYEFTEVTETLKSEGAAKLTSEKP